MSAIVVIGVGNEFRRDDGVGPAVVTQLADQVPAGVRLVISDGEPTRLIEAWAGAQLVIVIDAVRGNPSAPGRTHRFVAEPASAEPVATVSSHGLGLGEAIGLARALDRMPDRLIVHAVEATEFGFGVGLTPAVAAAADSIAVAVLTDLVCR